MVKFLSLFVLNRLLLAPSPLRTAMVLSPYGGRQPPGQSPVIPEGEGDQPQAGGGAPQRGLFALRSSLKKYTIPSFFLIAAHFVIIITNVGSEAFT